MARRPASSGLSEDFYWEEWLHVIQAQEVMEMEPGLAVNRGPSAEAMGRSLTKYLRVKRAGQKRRTALGRPPGNESLSQAGDLSDLRDLLEGTVAKQANRVVNGVPSCHERA